MTFVNEHFTVSIFIYKKRTRDFSNTWYSCSPEEGGRILKRLQGVKVVINGTFHSKIILMPFLILTVGILGKGEAKNWHPLWRFFVWERGREREKRETNWSMGLLVWDSNLDIYRAAALTSFMYTTIKSFPLFLPRDIRTIIYNLVSLSRNSFMLSQSSKFYKEIQLYKSG